MKKAFIIDIETDGLELSSKIVMVGCKDLHIGKEWVYNLQKEPKNSVYAKLKHNFEQYDIIIGYNIKDFDLEIIKNFFDITWRGKSIDLYYVLKNKGGLLKKKFKNFKLKTVVKTLGLEVLKGDIDFKVFQRQMTEDEEMSARNYLLRDLRATKELFMYLDKYFEEFKEFLREGDVENFNHFACNTGTFVYKFLCKSLGLQERYGEKEKINFTGGYVMQPRVDYAEGRIYCFDFNSLYPHILMMANLFSKKPEGWDGGIFELKGRYDNEEWGKVSKEIARLFRLRQIYKRAGNSKEYILKIILNTIYGLTGNSVFVNFFDKDIAADCTKIGRELIKMAAKQFEEKGYEILYGDTDSLYFKDVFDDKEKLLKEKREIVENMKKLFPFPQETFDLGVDYEIKRIVFFKKKLYVFQTKDDEVIIRGLPIIKDNATPLSYKVFEQFIKPEFIKGGKYLFTFNEIREWCYQLLEHNVSLIGKSFNLKPVDYYKTTTNIYYKLSKKYGEGVKVFIPNHKKGVGISVKYIPIEQVKKISIRDISIRSTLQELDYFCNEDETLKSYIKKEKSLMTQRNESKKLEVYIK